MCNPEVPIARAAAMIVRFYDLELAFVELFDIPRYMIGARRGLDMAIMHKWGDRPPPPIAPVLAEDLPASRQRDLLGSSDPDAPNYRPRWSVGLSLDPPRDGEESICAICGRGVHYKGAPIYAWWHKGLPPDDQHRATPIPGLTRIVNSHIDDEPPRLLFGIPIMVDPTIPPGEIRIRQPGAPDVIMKVDPGPLDPPAPPPGAISQCETCGSQIYFSGAAWWHAGGAPRDAHMPAPVRGIGGIYYEKGLWWEE